MTVATFEHQADATQAGRDFARWVAVLAPAAQLSERIADTDFVPESMRGNAAMVTAAIMYGDELGIGPMQALQGINVIRGKPSPSSELMRALVFRAGHSLRVLKSDGQTCRVAGQRKGDREATVIEWSLGMAQAAGLLDGDRGATWRRYPRAMLLARATSELCRVMFPDVVKGLGHVIDDDASAQEFDYWAATATGTEPEPERVSTRVSRQSRPVQNTELPAPTMPPDDGPTYPQEPASGDERHPEWPDGVSQPPLPTMPPAPPPAAAGSPPVPPAAAPPEPMPVPDDNEPERESEPIGSGKMLATIHMLFADIGLRDDDDRPMKLAIASRAVGRKVESTKLLTRREGLTLVRVLNDMNQGLLTFGINPDGTVDIYPPNESEPTP